MEYTAAQTALNEELRKIAQIEAVAAALGIKDVASQPDEFWQDQRYAAKKRFYLMCLDNLKFDLATRFEELDELECRLVQDQAQAYLVEQNMTYTAVRQWFLNYGQFASDAALVVRKERERLKSMVLRLLVLNADKGVSYLAYDDEKNPILVNSPELAYQFPVTYAYELERDYLTEKAKHFVAIQAKFGAKGVKLLAGHRNK